MESPESDSMWRQTTDACLSTHPEAIAAVTLRLWSRLAPELILIVGEEGFWPLYARSVRLTSARFPWMLQDATASALSRERFAPLQARLEAQDVAQALLGSSALLNTFLDLLASLVGEALTTHILFTAWSQEISEIPAKDFFK